MSEWLTIKQAAELIGISPEALRSYCNHLCPHSGAHRPLIEHVRHGSRGRVNARTGLKGTIKIRRDVAEAYLAACTHSPWPAPPPKPSPAPLRPYKRMNF